QDEFDFEYGEDFGKHIEDFDPTFSKVLVRSNPDWPWEINERQFGRLKRLSDWLHERGRRFLYELLVPATPEQLASVGGDAGRYGPGHRHRHHLAQVPPLHRRLRGPGLTVP